MSNEFKPPKVLSQDKVDALLGAVDKSDFSMNKIIIGVEAGIAKRKEQKRDATNPSHYSRWKIEPIDFIMANNLDFLRGNIIKYIMRYDAKGGLEDLKKARDYLDRLITKTEKEIGND